MPTGLSIAEKHKKWSFIKKFKLFTIRNGLAITYFLIFSIKFVDQESVNG
jgi:hypothetical protein